MTTDADALEFVRKLNAERDLERIRRVYPEPDMLRLRRWHDRRRGWFIVDDETYVALYSDVDAVQPGRPVPA
jgi:hypothetical protein